jgi:hypothetical protein
MKITSKISAALNLALMGVLIFVWLNARKPGAASSLPAAAQAEQPAPPAAAQTTLPVAPQVMVETAPFRWSQLVGTNNYQAFVANLRASGCPEATVEDIVRGDIERAFNFKRSGLHLDETAPGPWSARSQTQLVAYLLGQTPSATIASVDAASEQQPTAAAAAAVPALTAFLQNADLTPAGLNNEQKQQTASLRQSFLKQIAELNQAPGDPATPAAQPGADGRRSGWHPISQRALVSAQAESMLGGMFGTGAALQYEQYQAPQGGQQPQQQ